MSEVWKPDFTKENPYEGMPPDYPERVAITFVPTEDTPKSPIEIAVDKGWLDPSVLITEPSPPTTIHVGFIDTIFSLVWDTSDWFLNIYQEVRGWLWPFNYLQHPFHALYTITHDMLTPIAQFGRWIDSIATQGVAILTSEGILGLIKWWFPWLYDIGDWFASRWEWLTTAIGDWWDSTKTTVLGWIDIATEGLNILKTLWDEFWKITFPKWTATLEVLGSDVRDFFTTTLPDLVNNLKLENWWKSRLFDVDGLIGSRLVEWFPFYDDLVSIWNDMLAFFVDPFEFLLEKFTDWFLGKEK